MEKERLTGTTGRTVTPAPQVYEGFITPALQELFADKEYRSALGQAGFDAISEHAGATTKTLNALDSIGQ